LGTGAPTLTFTQNYGPSGLDAGVTDALGNTGLVQYGAAGNPYLPMMASNSNLADRQYAYFDYSSAGDLTSLTAPNSWSREGFTAQAEMDTSDPNFPLGRISSETLGEQMGFQGSPGSLQDRTVRYTYCDGSTQPYGAVACIYSPQPGTGGGSSSGLSALPTASVCTTFTYTALGNVQTVAVPAPFWGPGGPGDGSATVTYAYEYRNDPATGRTGFQEMLGQPIMVTDPMGYSRHYWYDGRGNITRVQDENGIQTSFTYNVADDLTQIAYPATGTSGNGNARTVYTYAYPGGPLLKVSYFDEGNHGTNAIKVVNVAEGNEGEVTSITGSTPTARFTFDPQYRLKQLTNGNNRGSGQTYDSLGNPGLFSFPMASETGADTIGTRYDMDGVLKSATDGKGNTVNYQASTFDSSLSSILYPTGTLPSVDIGYDDIDEPQSLCSSDGTGRYYQYDDLGNVTFIYQDFSAVGGPSWGVNYTYYPNGQRASATGAGWDVVYIYDADGRMTDIMSAPEPEQVELVHYDYDYAGNLKHVRTDGVDTTYSYNARNWLTVLHNACVTYPAVYTEYNTFSYDGLGNRLGMNVVIVPEDDTFNEVGQFSCLGAATFGYDLRHEVARMIVAQAAA